MSDQENTQLEKLTHAVEELIGLFKGTTEHPDGFLNWRKTVDERHRLEDERAEKSRQGRSDSIRSFVVYAAIALLGWVMAAMLAFAKMSH